MIDHRGKIRMITLPIIIIFAFLDMVSALKKAANLKGDLSENSNPNFNKTASTELGEETQSLGGATPPLIEKLE